jgi:hypothetical protein
VQLWRAARCWEDSQTFLAELPLTTHVLLGRVWRIRTAQPAMHALLLVVVRVYLGLIVLVLPNTKDCA